MNRQSFTEYLRQPAKLYQLSLTELRGLVLEYPYAANLRLLLLLKTRAEGSTASAEELEQTAVRTFDRRFLHDRLAALTDELAGHAPAPQEEFLELRDLAALEHSELELLAARQEPPIEALAESQIHLPPAESDFFSTGNAPADEDENFIIAWNTTPPSRTAPEPPLDAYRIPVHLIDAAAAVVGTLPAPLERISPEPEASEMEAPDLFPANPTASFISATASILHGLADRIAPLVEEAPPVLPYSPPLALVDSAAAVARLIPKLSFDREKSADAIARSEDILSRETPREANRETEREESAVVIQASLTSESLPALSSDDSENENGHAPDLSVLRRVAGEQRRRQLARLRGGQRTTPTPGAGKLRESAGKSISQREEVASETLARILVEQQQYKRAVKMYEKLCLLMPEKKAIFAATISELQKKR